ncbi:T9SS type A sorting domain-containing protein [Chitinophaga sp. Mgbs1]|uniref:T9SS type A sorting domain-containing protein n=1 Tax=Chitinophaga solisilvae TaxID=1233460 RepID=A0A9Q5D533_9BACT|nr:T9SS type A sorting domain-containing protein [Chitinophaga solisilvae]
MNLWSLLIWLQQTTGMIAACNEQLHCSITQQQGDSVSIRIRMEEEESGCSQLTILNSQHFPVRMIPFAPQSISAGQLVCVTGLPPGIYIVRITMAGKAAEKQFVIRQ